METAIYDLSLANCLILWIARTIYDAVFFYLNSTSGYPLLPAALLWVTTSSFVQAIFTLHWLLALVTHAEPAVRHTNAS